ncbi:MAG: hypothetical protein ACOC2H_10855, partial [Spirochaetota bacterium]
EEAETDQPALEGEAVPDDGSVGEDFAEAEDEAVEEPADPAEPEEEDTGTPRGEDRAVRRPAPVRREPVLRLLDAHGPDFTDRRIPDYTVPETKSQILADIDEPELQNERAEADDSSGEAAAEPKSTEEDDVQSGIEGAVSAIDYSLRNLIAWGSLAALLILLFVLYRARTGRKRRRVFRKIPSKRR